MAAITLFFSVQTSLIPGLKEVKDKKSITSTLEFLLPMMVRIVVLIQIKM